MEGLLNFSLDKYMEKRSIFLALWVLIFSSLCFCGPKKKVQMKEPDYTKGEELELSLRILSLGPTGASAKVWYNQRGSAEARTPRDRY